MGKLNKIFFCLGVVVCFYLLFGELVSTRKQRNTISELQEGLEASDDHFLAECYEDARRYNEGLYREPGVNRNSDYPELLNPFKNGIMGYIEIPKIDVMLPIYHGTEDVVFEKGVGHIYGSSLPVGGTSSHCLLAGHRGLPGAKLLTELGKMEVGDVFYIYVCERTFIYQVSEVMVIKPEDTENLRIREGKDRVSLITCTPYGINTHRLVVTGERREKEG